MHTVVLILLLDFVFFHYRHLLEHVAFVFFGSVGWLFSPRYVHVRVLHGVLLVSLAISFAQI